MTVKNRETKEEKMRTFYIYGLLPEACGIPLGRCVGPLIQILWQSMAVEVMLFKFITKS